MSISCLGLSFKKDSDDLRESPALYIIKKLSSIKFSNFYVVEPNLKIVPEAALVNVEAFMSSTVTSDWGELLVTGNDAYAVFKKLKQNDIKKYKTQIDIN